MEKNITKLLVNKTTFLFIEPEHASDCSYIGDCITDLQKSAKYLTPKKLEKFKKEN